MAKINEYGLDSNIEDGDKVIGTDVTSKETKNFPISALRSYILGGNGEAGQLLGIGADGDLTWLDCKD